MGRKNREQLGLVSSGVSRSEQETLCGAGRKDRERIQPTEQEQACPAETERRITANVEFLTELNKDTWFLRGFVWGVLTIVPILVWIWL